MLKLIRHPAMFILSIAAMMVFAFNADATSFITSAKIKDGTIQARDLSPSLRKTMAKKSSATSQGSSEGETGAQGSPGRDGRDGAQGLAGDTGPKGERGPAGRDGADGRSVSVLHVRVDADGRKVDGDGAVSPNGRGQYTVDFSTPVQECAVIISSPYASSHTAQGGAVAVELFDNGQPTAGSSVTAICP